MMNLQPVTLPTLEKSTAIYRNLMYHRTMILEPVRKIAFRNMRHLSKAIANHPRPDQADIKSSEAATWIEQIHHQMLNDQGMESSDLNRLLVQKATFTPVKLYVALLYAEIECLRKWRDEYPLVSNTDLGSFLQEQRDFIEHSKQFRHGLLHPNDQSIPSENA